MELVSDYTPSGDQPTAIAKLMDGIESGLAHQTLLGVTGSGKTYTIANVIANLDRPTMMLAPNKTLAAQLYGEMKEFFPNNAVEYFVSYYDYYQPEAYVPTTDTFIEKDASVNEHIEQMRLSATKALLERRDVIIIASVSAIYGLGDPDSYLKMMLHLRQGDIVNQRDVLRRLAELQYKRNDAAFQRATYRVRGDVIDIFPAESDRLALRVELFDEEIERISQFDRGAAYAKSGASALWSVCKSPPCRRLCLDRTCAALGLFASFGSLDATEPPIKGGAAAPGHANHDAGRRGGIAG